MKNFILVSLMAALIFAISFSLVQEVQAVSLTEKFENYGLSFKYPEGMDLSTSGIAGPIPPTEFEGKIIGSSTDHLLLLVWVKTPVKIDVSSLLEKGLEYLEDMEGYGALTVGEKGETEVKEHKVTYQPLSGEYEGYEITGVVGVWHCGESNRIFTLGVVSLTGDPAHNTFEAYLSPFLCHAVEKKCIIATVTFGSELEPEVQFLRSFRNNIVYSTFAGSQFMNAFNGWYYSFSPGVASFIEQQPALKAVMKVVLYPLLGILHLSSATHSVFGLNYEVGVVMAGLIASSLIGLVYFFPLTMIPLYFFKRRKTLPEAKQFKLMLIPWTISLTLIFIGEITGLPLLMMAASSAFVVLTIVVTAGAVACKVVSYLP